MGPDGINQMKRKTLLRASLLIVVAFAGVSLYLWATSPSRKINRGTFEKLQEGMTLAEVEAIVGYPPGNYSGSGALFAPGNDVDGEEACLAVRGIFTDQEDTFNAGDGKVFCYWASNSGLIEARFKDGKLSKTVFCHVRYNFRDMVRAWINRGK